MTYDLHMLKQAATGNSSRPHRFRRRDHFMVFARWRHSAPVSKTWFLGPSETVSSQIAPRFVQSFLHGSRS